MVRNKDTVLEHLTETTIVHYYITLGRSYDSTLKRYSTRTSNRSSDSAL